MIEKMDLNEIYIDGIGDVNQDDISSVIILTINEITKKLNEVIDYINIQQIVNTTVETISEIAHEQLND